MQPQFDHSNTTHETGERETCRGDVAIAADIRAFGGNKNRVKVIDLSQTGFRMESLTHISDSHAIFLTIPSFGQMEARIIWQTEWMYGCKFACPLHISVYEHIIRTHPALATEPAPVVSGMIYGAAASLQWRRAFG
ncbi:MAG: PilZ domain-containing protein [Sphingorhabdus sp.]